MRLIEFLAAVLLAGVVGCSRPAGLQDQFQTSDYRLAFDKRLHFEMAAPIIVMGDVVEVHQEGQSRKSPGDSRIMTQLTRIKIDVEEAIVGVVDTNLIDVYYFVYSQANKVDLGVPRYVPSVGQRRIYFLKVSNGIYRSIGDVTDYTLPVRTGSHRKGFCHGKEAAYCIAQMLLVPQQDVDAKSFVAHLPDEEYAAEVICSPSVAREMMQNLTQNRDRQIANGAREFIASEPFK
jgi:hypothetical protein